MVKIRIGLFGLEIGMEWEIKVGSFIFFYFRNVECGYVYVLLEFFSFF